MSAARLLPLTCALRAEAIKALTARSTWIGALLCLTIPVLLELYQTRGMRAELEAGDPLSLEMLPFQGMQSLMLAVPGVIVIGAGMVAGEFQAGAQQQGGARLVTTTVLLSPRRSATVIAKTVIALCLTLVLVAASAAPTLALTHHALGPWADQTPVTLSRLTGLALWWLTCMLTVMGMTALTRSAFAPVLLLIMVSTQAPPSVLASRVSDLYILLPDAAAWRIMNPTFVMAGRSQPISEDLSTGAATALLLAWMATWVTISVTAWVRRDV